MKTLAKNTIFTNVALTLDLGVWWEGMTDNPPRNASTGRDARGLRGSVRKTGAKAAHPIRALPHPPRSARRSTPTGIANGVPISAIIFGGRRATTMPLVYQAFNWSAGVYAGATMGSETTAAPPER